MDESVTSNESELRLSALFVIATVATLGCVQLWMSDSAADASRRQALQALALSCYASAAVALAMQSWKHSVASWFLVLAVTTLIVLSARWLQLPMLLTLLYIPPVVAAAMIGLPAAAATATAGTLLIALLAERIVAASGMGMMSTITLGGMWAATALVFAIYRPVYAHSQWLRSYAERVHSAENEVRDSRAQLKQALSDLASRNKELVRANERMATLRLIAEDAQKTKATFVANVSHELRTPLNMIIGLVELMAESPESYDVDLSPEMAEDLEVVLRNCEHLSALIDDVLDLTRTDSGRMTLYKERVDIRDIVAEATMAVRTLVEQKGLRLQVTAPDDLPPVYCDRTRIRQVLLNLVSNAARFTEDGGIDIGVTVRDEHVVVSVSDTGPGIASEDAARIFEPFSQGRGDALQGKGGSGLGLSISQSFVRLHQGRLWLETELGVGSRFVFELPFSPPMEHVARPHRWIRHDWDWRQGAFEAQHAVVADDAGKPRVVICDPEGTLRSAFTHYRDEIDLVSVRRLSDIVGEVQQCPANAVILNAASTNDLLPLVETTSSQTPATPVIGCSVRGREENVRSLGARGYLLKPVTRAVLEGIVRDEGGGRIRRVLIVDDALDALRLFRRMLSRCDETLEIETASSGQEALEKVRSGAFDLMLLDVYMPDMDGREVLRRLNGEGLCEDMRVYLVSARDAENRPPASNVLVTTLDTGLSISKLLCCSLELSRILLTPDGALDPVPQ